jgi:hypothetical protein
MEGPGQTHLCHNSFQGIASMLGHSIVSGWALAHPNGQTLSQPASLYYAAVT